MARLNGPINVFNPADGIPTDGSGGGAGGDSTAAAIATAGAQALAAQQTIQNLQGAATTLPAGSAATVTVTGTGTSKTINVGVPRGADGAPGRDGMGYAEGVELTQRAKSAEASAAQSRVRAEESAAAKLEIPDNNVSALVGNPATDTRQALDGNFERKGTASFKVRDSGLYLSPEGSDNNDGLSPGAPRQTLAVAAASLPDEGGVINVLGGIHQFTTPLPNKHHITLRGAGRLSSFLLAMSGNFINLAGGTMQHLTLEGLFLRTRGQHLIDLGSNGSLANGTIRNCFLDTVADGASIIRGRGTCEFLGMKVENTLMSRTQSATVPAVDLISSASEPEPATSAAPSTAPTSPRPRRWSWMPSP